MSKPIKTVACPKCGKRLSWAWIKDVYWRMVRSNAYTKTKRTLSPEKARAMALKKHQQKGGGNDRRSENSRRGA